MAQLNVPQCNRVIPLDPKVSLMQNLLNNNIPVASSCGGDGICGRCKMRVFTPAPLPEMSDLERKTLEKNKAQPGERLSCQMHLKESAQVETNYW